MNSNSLLWFFKSAHLRRIRTQPFQQNKIPATWRPSRVTSRAPDVPIEKKNIYIYVNHWRANGIKNEKLWIIYIVQGPHVKFCCIETRCWKIYGSQLKNDFVVSCVGTSLLEIMLKLLSPVANYRKILPHHLIFWNQLHFFLNLSGSVYTLYTPCSY